MYLGLIPDRLVGKRGGGRLDQFLMRYDRVEILQFIAHPAM